MQKNVPKEFESLRRNRKIRQALSVLLFPIFKLWIVGRHRDSAIKEVKNVNNLGGRGLVNYLGEHYKDPLFVQETKKEYLLLIQLIGKQKKKDQKFQTAISMKPSQFGFDIKAQRKKENQRISFQNMQEIVIDASKQGIEVEIDMENSSYTDFTLQTYKKLLEEFGGGIKVCLQANLKRTEKDLINIIEHAKRLGVKGGVRLVKGVYIEEQNSNAIHLEEKIIENFNSLVRIAFQNAKYLNIAVATHRPDVFNLADRLSKKLRVPYEPQMLKGIALKLKQERYKDQQNKVAVYIPYGEDALGYGMRRAKKFVELLLPWRLHWFEKNNGFPDKSS